MATVFQVVHADSKRQRCDSKCHNAQGDKCTCCCDGVNHGVGSDQARTDLKPSPDVQVLNHSNIHPVKTNPAQLSLF